MHPCLKQLTRCKIVTGTGQIVEATNSCDTSVAPDIYQEQGVCPRVTAESVSGEDYDLCGPPLHAEAEAAKLVPEGNVGGAAFLYGHTWLCGPCQHALVAKGIRTFIVTGQPA